MSHVVKGRGGTRLISSDWIQVREKSLLCTNRRRCNECGADVEPALTPHGAKVFLSRCRDCERKANVKRNKWCCHCGDSLGGAGPRICEHCGHRCTGTIPCPGRNGEDDAWT